jgi:hypothetical protein
MFHVHSRKYTKAQKNRNKQKKRFNMCGCVSVRRREAHPHPSVCRFLEREREGPILFSISGPSLSFFSSSSCTDKFVSVSLNATSINVQTDRVEEKQLRSPKKKKKA